MGKVSYVCADIHGCYDGLLSSLEKAGYDPSNPNYQLYTLGDNFGRSDRSPDNSGSLNIYLYLTSDEHKNPPKVIFGNHENIFLRMFDRQDFDYVDAANGEVKTLASFVGLTTEELIYWGPQWAFNQPIVRKIAKWMRSLPFYYDLEGGFRLFHGWQPDNDGRLMKNPVNVSYKRWVSASWAHTEDKIEKFMEKYPKGWEKTLVFGHWHARQLREHWPDGNSDIDGIWYDRQHKLIGLDPCSYYSQKVNVLVIEDGKIINEELL